MVYGRKHSDWSGWRRHFAWRPVKLIDGRRTWLEWVEISGFVENREIEPGTVFNVRLFGTSFCARLLDASLKSEGVSHG